MTFKTALATIVLLTIAACNGSGSPSATSATGQVTLGQAIVSWREFNVAGAAPDGLTNVMVRFRGVDEVVDDITNPADGCFPAMRNYEACRIANRELRLTKAESIRLATQAFAIHPTCSWAGYDPSYDALARGRGLASTADTRILFAQVRC